MRDAEELGKGKLEKESHGKSIFPGMPSGQLFPHLGWDPWEIGNARDWRKNETPLI